MKRVLPTLKDKVGNFLYTRNISIPWLYAKNFRPGAVVQFAQLGNLNFVHNFVLTFLCENGILDLSNERKKKIYGQICYGY